MAVEVSKKYDPSGRPNATMIRVEGVGKSYQGVEVLKDINFSVDEREVVAIIGASGCGKSTLLRLISGLEPADCGHIELEDPNFTLVFQYSALFDSLSVYDNVAFSLMEPPDFSMEKGGKFKKHDDAEIQAIVEEKLRLVGLEGIEQKFPNELSGGMQKRVSFARAIVSNPKIILYDEPTAGLDPIASTVIEDYILKLREELGAASVVVTHQFSTINRTADRVLLLHEGKICWTGTPKELYESEDPLARHFAHAGDVGDKTK